MERGRRYGNPVLDELEGLRKKEHHRMKVRAARNEGDKRLSQTMYDPDAFVLGTKYAESFISKHSKNPAKKLLQESERLLEIERTNKILFERMCDIAKKPHYSSKSVLLSL